MSRLATSAVDDLAYAADEWPEPEDVAAFPDVYPCPGEECKGKLQKVNKGGTIRKHKVNKGDVLPCTGSGAPILTARIPRRSKAGFYKDPATGVLLRSVTTILNQGGGHEALAFWAAKVTAETAMDNVVEMVAASRTEEGRAEFIKWLKGEPNRRKDERADVGSAVHKLIECRILGEPAPIRLLANKSLTSYITHFHRWVKEWEIEFEASEMVVAHYEDGYAGTLDYLFRSPKVAKKLGVPADTIIPGDTKTGGTLNGTTYNGDVHGVYPEAGLQMSAYRKAPWGWERNGDRIELPPRHDVGVILHLRPEGYNLYPVRCGDDMYDMFQTVRRLAEFNTGLAKNVVGEPLTLDDNDMEEVA
ncbi:hypothetical protein AB0K21_21765 [Streptosporangium sp. NPDC049248]|uniref:hypothetical protein n=1 Tax=Streptosporangium sp. NPDC049248 TaxID=3155651 RepID=UPI00341E3A7D